LGGLGPGLLRWGFQCVLRWRRLKQTLHTRISRVDIDVAMVESRGIRVGVRAALVDFDVVGRAAVEFDGDLRLRGWGLEVDWRSTFAGRNSRHPVVGARRVD